MSSDARCLSFAHHRLSGIRAAVARDIRRYATFSPEYHPRLNLATSLSIFFKPSILCLACYRVSHYLHLHRWSRVARLLSTLNLLVHKAHIPPESCIGPGCFLGHCPGLTFQGRAGENLTLLSLAICCPAEQEFGDARAGPRLGDGVMVGAHAVVIGNITVGDDVRVATNTWLSVDSPPHNLVYCERVRHIARRAQSPQLSDPEATL